MRAAVRAPDFETRSMRREPMCSGREVRVAKLSGMMDWMALQMLMLRYLRG